MHLNVVRSLIFVVKPEVQSVQSAVCIESLGEFEKSILTYLLALFKIHSCRDRKHMCMKQCYASARISDQSDIKCLDHVLLDRKIHHLYCSC